MARLSALSLAELDRQLANVVEPQPMHDLLMRATPQVRSLPAALAATVRAMVAAFTDDELDELPPRPRTALKLLAAGATDAAWEVLLDNGTGVVESKETAGARRPLLTKVEAPRIFADLPGFRDPRFAAPEDCYDITDTIQLKRQLDQVSLDGSTISFGGWAAIDVLTSDVTERVTLLVTSEHAEIAIRGRRTRRPDLVASPGDGRARRAWAGWSAELDLADQRLSPGSWALSVQIDHAGIGRRAPLGRGASDLARRGAVGNHQFGPRIINWETGRKPWEIKISDASRTETTPGTVGG